MRALAFLLALLWASPCFAAIGTPFSLGTASNLTGVSSTLVVTTGQDTPVGTQVEVALGVSTSTISGVADSVGNTYTCSNVTNGTNQIGFCRSLLTIDLPNAGTITATFSGVTGSRYMIAASVTGVSGGSDLTGTGTTGTNNHPLFTTAATNFTNEVVFTSALVTSGASDTLTTGSGFTSLAQVSATAASKLDLSYQLTSSKTTFTNNMTDSSSRTWTMNGQTFSTPDVVGSSNGLLMGVLP